jgi:serine/threonine protein kinase
LQWRAPEEYLDLPLNEKIDIWSLGNNMYSLLTGLYPLYHETDTHKVQKLLIKGRIGYIDPRYKERSFAEAKLAEIIPLCWKYDPDERISIFELVTRLRRAVAENKRRVQEEEKKENAKLEEGDDDEKDE